MPTDSGSTRATSSLPALDDAWILAQRSPKPAVDPWRAHGWLVEREPIGPRAVADVGTIFLANRECPFRCLMCDLWKYTTDERVPEGAIPRQIEQALAEMPRVQHLKLYNAGNFFDAQAIPSRDLPRIAELVGGMQRVIVECHPKLVGKSCLAFQQLLPGRLEIAMGLETVHPEVLPRLNKRMTLADFATAAGFLREHQMALRSFILLRPPFLSEEEGVIWARNSLEFAFDQGSSVAVVIPTRAGNGAMDLLAELGLFRPPSLRSLETVLEHGIALARGIVLADLWDARPLATCTRCAPERFHRLERMNVEQQVLPGVKCSCESCHAT